MSGDRREVHVERGESLVEMEDRRSDQIWWVSANMGASLNGGTGVPQ